MIVRQEFQLLHRDTAFRIIDCWNRILLNDTNEYAQNAR